MLTPMGLRLSPAKTMVVHLSDGFDFLGFHIQWRRKRGTNQWYVYTFIADRQVRQLKAKIRAITYRTSQKDLSTTLIRLNQIVRGWVNYFKHAVAKRVFDHIRNSAAIGVASPFAFGRIERWATQRAWPLPGGSGGHPDTLKSKSRSTRPRYFDLAYQGRNGAVSIDRRSRCPLPGSETDAKSA